MKRSRASSLDDPSWTQPISLASLPPGARDIYRTGSSVVVATMPVGCGTVTYLGWDWYNAEPVAATDGGWVEVLNRALGQERRMYVDNDFSGDGHADILWRNLSTGNTLIWLAEDAVKQSAQSIGSVPAVWDMAGTGDFNKDCKADILWRNTANGQNIIWLMDGFAKTAGAIPTVPVVWEVRSVKDYTADGASDILFRNTSTGLTVIWEMLGFTKVASHTVGKPPLSFTIEE